ncbi:hypothetical protein Tsubulata_017631 [Turnera subulata]|uniref:ENT domain-containing protein n=1 Tax=Turnera subulata TaxID=218843 RepID=A0A9Q0G4T8_9ROSI|nr:hypothetical protein Tsubulata_017631 [Turnera subulata]
MEAQIHHLEQEAYSAVLRAFKAQSDAITWEKEGLITELRKELRVSDDEHRELLSRVNGDDIIRRIREWRQAGGHQAASFHDVLPSPTVSASRKKQKTSTMGTQVTNFATIKSMPYPSPTLAGSRHFANRNEHAETTASDPLIGRSLWTRWPEDNNWYKAVITAYNAVEGRHSLLYDINTDNATWEWVDLKEMSPEDIRWEGEDPGINYRGIYSGGGHGTKKSMSRGSFVPSVGRGKGTPRGQQSKREFLSTQNGITKKVSGDIELLNTESLVKEVEKVFGVTHPDPLALEKAKKMLKEHEQALVDAIARLADTSDGESGKKSMFSLHFVILVASFSVSSG